MSAELFGLVMVLAALVISFLSFTVGFRRGRAGRSAVDYSRGYVRGRIEFAAQREQSQEGRQR